MEKDFLKHSHKQHFARYKKALHRTAIPLRSIAPDELIRCRPRFVSPNFPLETEMQGVAFDVFVDIDEALRWIQKQCA